MSSHTKSTETQPLSASRLRRLRIAQRQLERARAAVEAAVGADYHSPEGERLLDGFDLAEHHLGHTLERELDVWGRKQGL